MCRDGALAGLYIVDEKVLGLQIAMENTMLVAVGHAVKQLKHEGLQYDRVDYATCVIQKALEILWHAELDTCCAAATARRRPSTRQRPYLVTVLKHERKHPIVVEHVEEPHDVGVP